MDTLAKGKMRLVLNHPFFASTAIGMQYIEDASVGTMAIGRRYIKYNPAFVDSLTVNQVVGLLAHEVLHYLLLHHTRAIGKNADVWNQACDYAINAILRKEKIELPSDHLYAPQFEDMDAEQIYSVLMKNQKQEEQQSGSGDGDAGDNAPQNWGKVEAPDADEASEAEAEAKKDAAEAISVGKQAGTIPNDLQTKIHDLLEPKKNWRELLLKYLAEKAKDDYTWTRPSARYLPMGLYLPSLDSITLGKVVFAIDTSGSVDEKLLNEFVSEIKEASTMFNFPVTVVQCDTRIQHIQELESDTEIEIYGRGGTEFTPVFDWVNENMPDVKALVYFTDGECWDRPQAPEYDVLWVIYDNKNYKSSFGEIIYIE